MDMNNTLESQKFFPYFAWTSILICAGFTYSLILNVRDEMNGISSQVTQLETRVSNIEAKEMKK